MKFRSEDIDIFESEMCPQVKLREFVSEGANIRVPATTKVKRLNGVVLYKGNCMDILPMLPPDSIHSCVIDPEYGVGTKGRESSNFSPDRLRQLTKRYEFGEDRRVQSGKSPAFFAGAYDMSRRGAVKYQQWCCKFSKEIYRVLKPGAHLVATCSPRMYHRLACGVQDAGFEIVDQLQWIFGSNIPKSLDIAKAIDKLAGAKREIVGENPNLKGRKTWGNKSKYITLPVTQEAKKWAGWGTALKSLSEPILLARKPILARNIAENILTFGTGGINISGCKVSSTNNGRQRFPSNIIISDTVAAALGDKAEYFKVIYCPKPSRKAKDAGCGKNSFPSVKPLLLTEYLITLVTPLSGTVLDCFMGSGTTGVACVNLGFRFIGIEIEQEYFNTAFRKIKSAQSKITEKRTKTAKLEVIK